MLAAARRLRGAPRRRSRDAAEWRSRSRRLPPRRSLRSSGCRCPVAVRRLDAAHSSSAAPWRSSSPARCSWRRAGSPRPPGLPQAPRPTAGRSAPRRSRPSRPSPTPTSLALIAGTPPNGWDPLNYHLPRVGFWLQSEQVGYIDAAYDPRMNFNPPNGEVAMTFVLGVTRQEVLSAFVQLAAALACAARGLRPRPEGRPRPARGALRRAAVPAHCRSSLIQSTTSEERPRRLRRCSSRRPSSSSATRAGRSALASARDGARSGDQVHGPLRSRDPGRAGGPGAASAAAGCCASPGSRRGACSARTGTR